MSMFKLPACGTVTAAQADTHPMLPSAGCVNGTTLFRPASWVRRLEQNTQPPEHAQGQSSQPGARHNPAPSNTGPCVQATRFKSQ